MTIINSIMKQLLEVCAGNMASVEAAAQAGARRIELCSHLQLDGLTPPLDVLRQVRKQFPDMLIHVLIRLREGDFVYDEREINAMERCIEAVSPWADGVVCGALTADAEVNVDALRRLVNAAQGKSFTFHRAFDVCSHPFRALEQIIDAGCDRVLTSGGQPTAQQGMEQLRQLQQCAGSRIIIMPGGGVNASNARQILDYTGCREIHGSCSAGTGITQVAEVRRIIASL